MVRSNGTLHETSWDEAMAAAAAGLGSVRAAHSATALGMFSCSKATNEVNYLAQKLARTVLGTNNIDSCNRT
jgi:formate dehydrogenase major subunit